MGRQRHDIGHRKSLARLHDPRIRKKARAAQARRARRAERRAAALDRWQATYDALLEIQDREIERRRRAAERAARAVLATPERVAVPAPTPVPRPEPDPGPDVPRRCTFAGCNRRAERRHGGGRSGYRPHCRRHRRKLSEQRAADAA
jgi:hypothetical protein